MARAGYSGTPLPQKLGIREGHTVALVGAPKGFDLGVLPTGSRLQNGLRGKSPLDVIVVFVKQREALAVGLATWRARMTEAGGLWIAWPKKSSGVATDIVEQTIRDIALPTGLVDNKVCAIDEIWSGLRLVIRTELRSQRAPARTPRRASPR